MKHFFWVINFIILASFFFLGCSSEPVTKNIIPEKFNPSIAQKVNEFRIDFAYRKFKFNVPYGSQIDSIETDTIKKSIIIDFNANFSYQPFRKQNVEMLYSGVKSVFGDKFADYSYTINTLKRPVEDLIPNYYRNDPSKYDSMRLPVNVNVRPLPVVQNISREYLPSNGLLGKNIVLWPSHGWYYNNKTDRWEWQRPRLFQSVEDILPLSFVVPYLIPMLENAGALVFDPRERDIQKNSIVIDNDSPSDIKLKYYIEKSSDKSNKWRGGVTGFAVGNPPYSSGYNPFTKGTSRIILSDTNESASTIWMPNIPVEGKYAVYISYSASGNNADDAEYTVFHEGIETNFRVNQQVGGSTWIYLGEFSFDKGYNPGKDKVVLSNKSSEKGKIISADAVRFGGGEGIIERGGSTSNRPKIFEAARYYLQYAGMPDTLVYNLDHDTSDYTDDYKSRAEYVNYLYGRPFGPNRDRDAKGLGIPIDLSLAFHTDAGIVHSDTSVGTLAIYSIPDEKKKDVFPGGTSRFVNRDFADIIQTQIVSDIRAKYDSTWTRRPLENSDYSEVVRSNVPSVLIELLSHQNFNDMKLALDPGFRFDVSRAIYKGILRFLSAQYKTSYIVQPLPVKNFSSSFDKNGNVNLKWKPTVDALEPTAIPEKYIIYTRINNGSFDNGKIVNVPDAIMTNILPGIIYSYKVTAVNKGGESFPSEILSVCRMDNNKQKVLIINGFYRVSGPAIIEDSRYNGFFNTVDPGIPDKYDLSFTGNQYDFDSTHQFISNDNPGWGASYSDNEAKIVAGNTFDYPYVHGLSIKESGYSFVSAGAGAVEDSSVDLSNYKFVDLILGGQKFTNIQKEKIDDTELANYKTYPKKLQKIIDNYTQTGGNLFISGSYVASDLFNSNKIDSSDVNFATTVLKYKLDADHASKDGEVYSVNSDFINGFNHISYNTDFNDSIYTVQASDAINSTGGSRVILRYKENGFPAAIAYKAKYGVVVLGFPFETIINETVRNEMMKEVISYLLK
ncbi:MAG: hypothetical protein WCA84_00330 [Ignavibacteriaceae bacterium]|jgi:hypothetical protein